VFFSVVWVVWKKQKGHYRRQRVELKQPFNKDETVLEVCDEDEAALRVDGEGGDRKLLRSN